ADTAHWDPTGTSVANAPGGRLRQQHAAAIASNPPGCGEPRRSCRAARLLVGDEEQREPPLQARAARANRGGGGEHRDESTLHVRAAAAKQRVALLARRELIARISGNDVVVTVEIERRTGLANRRGECPFRRPPPNPDP